MELILRRKTELALRALRVLDTHGGTLQGAGLAAKIDTTQYYLTQVMAPLVEAGWVRSGRGPTGGYQLSDGLANLSLLELVRATEGEFPKDKCVLRDGACKTEDLCDLHDSWQRLQKAVVAEFGGVAALGESQ